MNKPTIEAVNKLFTEALPFILSDETYKPLQSLPEKQRLCFILRYIYDYSYTQIAETLGTTVSYVSVMLVRARSVIVVNKD